MEKTELPSQQRISKTTKRSMVGLAIFFDLLPILLLFAVVAFVIYTIGGSIGEDATNYAKATAAGMEDIPWYQLDKKIAIGVIKVISGGSIAVKGGAAVIGGGATGIFIGPFVYMAGSFFASTIAYFIFTIWFFLKGVNIWSFGNTKRALINMITLIVENIPGFDLLPGITIMVWGHAKIAETEDRLKEKEFGRKIVKVLNAH